MTRDEVIKICKERGTIPTEKLEFDASKFTLPTHKDKIWIDTYFEKSKWEELDPDKFKRDVIEFITNNYKGEYIFDFKCKNSTCDIFLPSEGIGFKLISLFDYSEINVDKKKQLLTWNDFESENYHIIQIFEDSWNLKEDIVKNRIMNTIGLSQRIYARKCDIRVVNDNTLVKEFVEKSHIQGNIGSSIKLGLYYNSELVSLMTFGTLRKNLGQTGQAGSYEILRFCNKYGLNVVGGASKLFKYFIDVYDPISVISYADKCWSSTNCLYTKIGMEKVHDSDPSYFYIIGTRRKGRFGYRKDIVLQIGLDGNHVGEHTGMLHMECYRIFDCGTAKYEWKKK